MNTMNTDFLDGASLEELEEILEVIESEARHNNYYEAEQLIKYKLSGFTELKFLRNRAYECLATQNYHSFRLCIRSIRYYVWKKYRQPKSN